MCNDLSYIVLEAYHVIRMGSGAAIGEKTPDRRYTAVKRQPPTERSAAIGMAKFSFLSEDVKVAIERCYAAGLRKP